MSSSVNFERNSVCFQVGRSRPLYAKAACAAQNNVAYEQIAQTLKQSFCTAYSAPCWNSFARAKISFGVKNGSWLSLPPSEWDESFLRLLGRLCYAYCQYNRKTQNCQARNALRQGLWLRFHAHPSCPRVPIRVRQFSPCLKIFLAFWKKNPHNKGTVFWRSCFSARSAIFDVMRLNHNVFCVVINSVVYMALPDFSFTIAHAPERIIL